MFLLQLGFPKLRSGVHAIHVHLIIYRMWNIGRGGGGRGHVTSYWKQGSYHYIMSHIAWSGPNKPSWPWPSCGGCIGWSEVTIELVWDTSVEGVSIKLWSNGIIKRCRVVTNLTLTWLQRSGEVVDELIWDTGVRSVCVQWWSNGICKRCRVVTARYDGSMHAQTDAASFIGPQICIKMEDNNICVVNQPPPPPHNIIWSLL